MVRHQLGKHHFQRDAVERIFMLLVAHVRTFFYDEIRGVCQPPAGLLWLSALLMTCRVRVARTLTDHSPRSGRPVISRLAQTSLSAGDSPDSMRRGIP
jgi:hypothetical protein